MEEDYQMALELSFTCGYGDQLEVLDCTPDSSNFLSLKCFASLRCPLSWHPLKKQLPGCILERGGRSMVENPLLGN